MAEVRMWWRDAPGERFWLESTDREDIGHDLRAPLADEGGRDNWRYTLFRLAEAGDVVFHYDKRVAAITGVSRIAGPPVDHPIVWAARGSYARDRGALPEEVDGYRMALTDHRALSQPLTLAALRDASPALQALHDDLLGRFGRPLYFPFELSGRPVRPLQGYAFKLPRAFVEAFPGLQAGLAGEGAAAPGDPFRWAIAAIESASAGYRVGSLQADRARRLGLKRVAKSIFGDRVQAPDWAFHYGGRGEIQFNVGMDRFGDGEPAFRTGLAFSFEPSRHFPDPSVLAPRVARFNSWLHGNGGALEGLSMWHWQGGERSGDYAPAPIPAERLRPDTFVFLGDRQRMSAFDPHRALRIMDRLYPLYEWVEAGPAEAEAGGGLPGPTRLNLQNGKVLDGGRWVSATTVQRTLDIYLRHAEIQRRLVAALASEGCAAVAAEVSLGRCLIDVVARRDDGLWFYEIKTAPTVRACLREAIGQLLEYALWPGGEVPARLVVVGEPPLDGASAAYLEALNAAFPLPITYRQLAL